MEDINPNINHRQRPSIPTTVGQAKIFSLDQYGCGVALINDQPVSIPFALPLESIDYTCQHFKKKKKYSVSRVLSSSPDRAVPVCQHFSTCGGCMLQHLSLNLYKEFKQKLLIDALLRYDLDPFLLKELTVLPFGYRRRANLDIVKKGDVVHLGFHRYQSHQLIDLQECHTLHPLLRDLLHPLKHALNDVLEPFEKAKIFFTKSAVGVDASLEIQGVSSLTEEKRTVLREFSQKNNLARFSFKYRKSIDHIYQTVVPVVHFDGVPVPIDAYCFLQALDETDLFLANFIKTHVPKHTRKSLDLFCGRGTLSFPLSSISPVESYEYDAHAVEVLNTSAQSYARPIKAYKRDLFENPLDPEVVNTFDTIVINPPRAGAKEQIERLAKTKVETIIYVSCNPDTFARDARILVDGGNYTVSSVHGLDQFAWSAHIETIAVLKGSTSK